MENQLYFTLALQYLIELVVFVGLTKCSTLIVFYLGHKILWLSTASDSTILYQR